LINATLVSYINLDDFLSPLANVKRLENVSLILLFVSGLALAIFFYRDIHYNLRHLIEKIERFGKGNYSSRVTIKPNNEFRLLFTHFNRMAGQIQSLIENVYEEKIRTREAEYKHLQAQINPHFLYNCLFYIVTMANRSPEAVISMADNLAKYYQYVTNKSGSETTVREEITFIENYLRVQSLRNKRIKYTIDIPEELDELVIPPLSIQPIIENAIIHGIDQKRDAGHIMISGNTVSGGYEITIEDDGIGMSLENIKHLSSKLNESMNMDMGHGLWNSHQRLKHRFGANSGLQISSSSLGGLRITINLDSKKS